MYKRILLKLSGEALKEKEGNNTIDADCINSLADVIKQIHDSGIEICIVIGAGNIWRGKVANKIGIEPIPADFMGMLGTVINAVALCSSLKKKGVDGIVYSAVNEITNIVNKYDINEAKKSLNEGKVVFLAGGTGKPFFTTDTAATLRALELNCEAILMGKNGVDGIYDKDPRVNKDAKFFENLTFNDILKLNLQVMDLSAIELIKNKDIIVRVFSMDNPNNFMKVINGEKIGTLCYKGD